MNLGMPEMIFIFLLALVIFGPKKLPELGRQLGKALAEFKKASNEFKNQLEVEMMNIELEERAKKLPEASPRILPAEKLFDTAGVPPTESVPRTPLPPVIEASPMEAPAPDAATLNSSNTQPVSPDVPSHNA